MASEFPKKTEKPWGYELLFAHTPAYAGKLIFVKAGHRLSLQYHQQKDESLYLHQGKARIEVQNGDGQWDCVIGEPGYAIRIEPHTRHRLQAIEDSVFFEVSTPELDDIVRISDDYGRAG